MKYIIKDNQAGFVLKNGVFQKMITAGTYHFSKMAGYTVVTEEMLGELDYLDVPYQVLSKDPLFVKSTVHMEIPDGSVGFLYMNGKLTTFASRKEYVFWNVFDRYEIKIVSMADTVIGAEVTKQMLALVPGHLYTEVKVGEGETGLVYYDNVMQAQLSKGVYRFWNYHHAVTFYVLDMKQKEMDILGQEILTKDKIGIRMNVACMYKIRDAVEFISTISDLKAQLYPAVQLAIREIVGNYKLDEILEAKEQISKEIFEALKKREEMFCVNFLTAGIRDIILPGEIREIMNSVLVAEKAAQANVISRREEVASTRSLLNTAKLMDENQTLYRLKELEYLERICQKVGEISVNGSEGMLEQLGKMMGTGQRSSL
ncbi:MAG: slipin family protein [Eubacterium sp.]|nr:slipin family protein [Eubacterium sp.]MCM1303868.1 slipin family protein [Butyrivibrio sp.]MCM1343609.1 slipin family protein [Muribaculaceae bacterium]MCM1410801.1 slipin family protein [Lachnospiraceae bacterium]